MSLYSLISRVFSKTTLHNAHACMNVTFSFHTLIINVVIRNKTVSVTVVAHDPQFSTVFIWDNHVA